MEGVVVVELWSGEIVGLSVSEESVLSRSYDFLVMVYPTHTRLLCLNHDFQDDRIT